MSSPDVVRTPEEISVPVDGGNLAALHWPADAPAAPLVVLLHDLVDNAAVWLRVGAALAGPVEVVAPDLRGRAGSATLPGGYGIGRHAADLTALLDHLGADGAAGAEATVLVGHGLGAFVAVLAVDGVAAGRAHGLVLLDGGLPLAAPPAANVDDQLAAVYGATLDRLAATFPDDDAVLASWADHPTIGPWVTEPDVAGFLGRDLTGAPPQLRSAVVPEAVRVDGSDLLDVETVLEATSDLPVPATLLWATRGPQGGVPGLYDDARLARLAPDRAGVVAREVPDTDHWSLLWTPAGVVAVTEAVRAAVERDR